MVGGLSSTQTGTTSNDLLLGRVNGLSQGGRLDNLGLRLGSESRGRLGYRLLGLELLYLWLLKLLRRLKLLWLLELLWLGLESRGSGLLELLLYRSSGGRRWRGTSAGVGVTAEKVVERPGDTREKATLLRECRAKSENTQTYQ